MQSTHARRNQKHVINLHLEFVRRTQIGIATFTVEDVKIGSRISNLHITLSQKDDGSDNMVNEVEGYVMMTNINAEDGATLDTGYKLLPPPLAVSLLNLAEGKDTNYVKRGRDPVVHIRKASKNIQMHPSRIEQRPPNFPKAMLDQWIRFYPRGKNGRFTNDALGFVVDMFPQLVEQYINSDVETAVLGRDISVDEVKEMTKKRSEPRKAFWYPTLNLNLDVKKALPEEGVEWLFLRVQASKIQNGRFDLHVTVLDEQGDLVAISHHATLAVDMSRNTTRSKKPKQSKM